ncbi:major facilitator superfamily domain-containing protein [Crucibulum laeve]|uniref:Major facilitator superfamily domain-containing protein n=1 Tax=Crucibulum laeve TaxID=68775 RepID=A0A5C3MGT6_9AGAR|nr:major facilitator superfamily domain-containing protein [Crucibulum laeve]
MDVVNPPSYSSSVDDQKTAFEEDVPINRGRVLRKLDLYLLPFISALYLLTFLDRSNVANARVVGMGADLHLDGLKFNVAAAVFSIPYALAEIPSNIALKLFKPSRWIPFIMLVWGIIQTLMVLVSSYEGLVTARVFLGLAEAGLFPGVTLYLSLWYPRSCLAVRISLFFAAGTIAGAFGGILAYCIEKMDGLGGRHGWQWIFCLEGLLTVTVAIFSYFYMHDDPDTASFLTAQEREYVVGMLKEETTRNSRFDKRYIWQAITDYKTYLQLGIQMGLLIPAQSISLFAPTIINELGYSAARAQLLIIPIFVAGCFMTIAVGIMSDRYKIRGPFIVGGCLVSLVGYIVLYTHKTPAAGYIGAIIGSMGVYPTVPINLVWAGGNASGDLKRAVVIAMVLGIGNLGGLCAAFIYFDGPKFHVGHGTIMAWLSLSIILSCIAMYDCHRSNKAKEIICKRDNIDESRKEEFIEMGDQSPLFRYAI